MAFRGILLIMRSAHWAATESRSNRFLDVTIDGTFAETAILDYRLSFDDQGKQTSVSGFRLQQTNGSLPFSVFRLQSTNGVAVFHFRLPQRNGSLPQTNGGFLLSVFSLQSTKGVTVFRFSFAINKRSCRFPFPFAADKWQFPAFRFSFAVNKRSYRFPIFVCSRVSIGTWGIKILANSDV
jgi:hypothetical protein